MKKRKRIQWAWNSLEDKYVIYGIKDFMDIAFDKNTRNRGNTGDYRVNREKMAKKSFNIGTFP